MTIAQRADVLLIFSGLVWTVFGILCGLEHGLPGALLHAAVPGLMILAVAWLAWHQPVWGGGLAVALGIGSWLFFGRTTNGFVLSLMQLPLLLGGGELLWAGLTGR